MRLSITDRELLSSFLYDLDKNEFDLYSRRVSVSIRKILNSLRTTQLDKSILKGYIDSNYLRQHHDQLSLSDFDICLCSDAVKSRLINLNDHIVLYNKISKSAINSPKVTFELIEQINASNEFLIFFDVYGLAEVAIIIANKKCVHFKGSQGFNTKRFVIKKLSQVNDSSMRRISRTEMVTILSKQIRNPFAKNLYQLLTV